MEWNDDGTSPHGCSFLHRGFRGPPRRGRVDIHTLCLRKEDRLGGGRIQGNVISIFLLLLFVGLQGEAHSVGTQFVVGVGDFDAHGFVSL